MRYDDNTTRILELCELARRIPDAAPERLAQIGELASRAGAPGWMAPIRRLVADGLVGHAAPGALAAVEAHTLEVMRHRARAPRATRGSAPLTRASA